MDDEALCRIAAALERIADALERQPARSQVRSSGLPMPAKGFRCPACDHYTANHREHGCDMDCACQVPHGRIPPGDPNPASGCELGTCEC